MTLLILVAYAITITGIAAIYAFENADQANRINVMRARHVEELALAEDEVRELRWLLSDARRPKGSWRGGFNERGEGQR